MHLWKAAIEQESQRERNAGNVQHRRVFNTVAGGGSVPKDVLRHYLKKATTLLQQTVSKKELEKERSKYNKQVADIQLKMDNQKELFNKLQRVAATAGAESKEQAPNNKFQLPNIDLYSDEVWATVTSEYSMETVDAVNKIILHKDDKVIIRRDNAADMIDSGHVYIKKPAGVSGASGVSNVAPNVFFERYKDAINAADSLENGEQIRLLLNKVNQVVVQYMYFGQVPIEHLSMTREEIRKALEISDNLG